MSDKNSKIVVADDDPANRLLLNKILTNAGYSVHLATSGPEVFKMVPDVRPSLFLLDILMPEMNGLEVCRRLKQDPAIQQVPVIFITSMDKTDDIVQGFNVGAADYITKPVNKAEVLARVQIHIRLYDSVVELERLNRLALDANPLTGLPGNNSLVQAITEAIKEKKSLCVVYCDMDNFKAFNDKYGFARGDKAIIFAAETIKRALEKICGPGHFMGHIGGDDYSILVPCDMARAVCEEIARTFDEGICEHYDGPDREAGCIVSTDRQGESRQFPLITLSMGGVDLTKYQGEHYLKVANACAEVKKMAKSKPGSSIYFDERGEK